MHNPIPKPDTFQTWKHSDFDEIGEVFAKSIKIPNLKAQIDVSLVTNHSDIKWNNMSGILQFNLTDGNVKYTIAHMGIDCFTGNCGVKAIDHLNFYPGHNDVKERIVKIFESFLYHRTNCGYVIGSDTIEPHPGETIKSIKSYGKNYEFSKPTWNPNYIWSGGKGHKIALFSKDLNKEEHFNYWS